MLHRLFLAIALSWPAFADGRVEAVRDLLFSMRGTPPVPDKVRGASTKLTAAKHQLRDWIESRMGVLDQRLP